MASGKIASWAFSEQFVDESLITEDPGVLQRARERSSALGLAPVLAGSAAHVRASIALAQAKTVVEVGTGSGVLSLYILSGMGANATLTTIDPEPENQRLARESFTEAGFGPSRVRTINGHARDVLARLNRGAYDAVVLPAEHEMLDDLVERSKALLRPGGVLLVVNALHHDRVAETQHRDPVTERIRATLASLAEDRDFVCAMNGAGDGVVTAVLRG